jgi:hypothetical protein
MKRTLIVIALVVLVGSGFALREIAIPADADTYVLGSTPSTNYGTSTSLLGKYYYTMLNNKETAFDYAVIYLHFPTPTNLVGKIKVLAVANMYYIDSIKTKSPYTSKETVYSATMLHANNSWSETTLTCLNQPYSTSPIIFDADTTKKSYNPVVGWNKFLFTPEGIMLVQDTFERPKTNYGAAIQLGVFPPAGTTIYADGTYLQQVTMSSRETIKKAPYMILQYDWKSGVIPTASEIQTKSLGEVKATYR